MSNRKEQFIKTLSALDDAIGVSGNEEEVAEILRAQMTPLCDEHFEDALGNQFFVKHGTDRSRRILFASHMDEIGFIINNIEERGFARIFPVGFHDERNVINQHLTFVTASGKKVRGVTGAKPFCPAEPNDCNPVKHCMPLCEIFVDFGTNSAEATRALGIEIGDYGAYSCKGYELNGSGLYTGKSLDNRAGLTVMVEAMRQLCDIKKIIPDVYMAGTVQEEVGMRSGAPITARVNPELMLAIDITFAGDMPYSEYVCSQKIGGGVCIKFYDWAPALGMAGNNVPRKLTKRMIEVAQKHGIPFQREVIMRGGTDAWSAQGALHGVLAGAVGIPLRYVHSATGVISVQDLETCADFIVKFLADYN
ncbi:MAG: M42 family metallopeptidase [Treponemataceae bacterium]|nr:MAG: M42 family metallopeptidase [Treponemataceae bacterium]